MKVLLVSAVFVLSSSFRLPAAVIIDFSGTPGSTNSPIPASFASNVPDTGGVNGTTVTNGAGAPDIALQWAQSTPNQWQFYPNWSTLGSVAQLDTATIGSNYDLSFTPSGGTAVSLASFDMAVFAGYTQDVVWSVFAQGDPLSVLATGDTGLVTGGTLAKESIGFTGAAGQAYTLRLTRIAGGSSATNALAITNITFSEIAAVPEPGTYGLSGAAALTAVALVRRRLRRR